MKFAAVVGLGMALFGGVSSAEAQSWTGFYLGGTAGAGFQRADDSEKVRFDTNLDGSFGDSIRTVAGADAFGPGFCGGLAVDRAAAAGCTEDEDGLDFGGRLGYDRQFGRMVVGGLIDVSRTDVVDSVTAFSVTPAFYSFTRELSYVAGLRGRLGVTAGRMLIYGTGGGAWGQVEQDFTTSNTVNTFTSADDADDDDGEGDGERIFGYQAGGGIEFLLTDRWSLGGEYLFTSLDDREESGIRVQGPAPATNPFILVNAAGTDLRRADAFEFQSIRFGVRYRF